jgi:hypothetical protein
VHKQWIRIAHSSVLHTQLDKWVAQYMPSKMNTVKWCSSRLKFSISMYAQKCTSVITRRRERNCDVHQDKSLCAICTGYFFCHHMQKSAKETLVLWSFTRRCRKSPNCSYENFAKSGYNPHLNVQMFNYLSIYLATYWNQI